MNLMGFDAEALGNHSFDRGEQYLRNELIPLADFAILSANVVDPNGKTPAEWAHVEGRSTCGGVKVGVIGFTTEDTPNLVFPGRLGPFSVTPVVAAVNAEAARLRAPGRRPRSSPSATRARPAGRSPSPTGPLSTSPTPSSASTP